MLTDSSVYINVERGLLEAPSHLKDSYDNYVFRYVAEALLLDPTVPDEVFSDLLGWERGDKEIYREYFFCLPNTVPRLVLFQFIDSMVPCTEGKALRKRLMLSVFDRGWEYIDIQYNQGRRVSIQRSTIKNLKKMFGQVDELVSDCLRNPEINKVQNVFKLLKSGIELESKSKGEEQSNKLLISFVEEIREEGAKRVMDSSKIMGMDFDELNRVKQIPKGSKDQTTLNDIFKDIGQPEYKPDDK